MKRFTVATIVGLAVAVFFTIHGTSWQEPSAEMQQQVAEAFTLTTN